jgi:hypothetical protein
MPVIGLDVNLAGGGGLSAPAAAANLLRWTEEFDNAVWVTGSSTVTPDTTLNPAGTETTADTIVFASGDDISQVSSVLATTGSAGLNASLGTSFLRYGVTTTMDGLPYTFSLYLKGLTGGEQIRLLLTRSGGFIVCKLIENLDLGSPATVFAWGAQLEASASATTYQHRTT